MREYKYIYEFVELEVRNDEKIKLRRISKDWRQNDEKYFAGFRCNITNTIITSS